MKRLTGNYPTHAAVVCYNCNEQDKSCDLSKCFRVVAKRLADIEDIIGDEYDMERLRELVEADKDGRIRIIPKYIGKACGSCEHFHRIAGTRRGTCEVKPCATSRCGTQWPDIPFEPSQSRMACKQYKAAEAAPEKKGKADNE